MPVKLSSFRVGEHLLLALVDRRGPAADVFLDYYYRKSPETRPRPTRLAEGVKAYAEVNHGRWLVSCPFGCGSAQLGYESDHRFWCVECGNLPADGEWVEVVWPAEIERAAIEHLLSRRLLVQHYNWRHTETVAQLEAENAKHATKLRR